MEGNNKADNETGGASNISDEKAKESLAKGDNKKIDRTLVHLGVGKSPSGEDERGQPDSDGSDSSSRNTHEE